ncbi:hypothetical protein ACHAWX_000885 [Stephanocyclus meneghinianus]
MGCFVELALTYDLRKVLASLVNHFVFMPMLVTAAVGTVEYRSLTKPIWVTNPYIDNFVEGRAIGVDVEEYQDSKQLWTAISKLEFARHLDVQEFYYESEEMQAQARARRQRRVWIAIVGGGPTGVELAGDLVDFNLQVCGRANGAFQHLMDDVVSCWCMVLWNFFPPWMWI